MRVELVDGEVAVRMEEDRSAITSVGVDAQDDLLGHRAAGHEDRGRLPEDRGDLGLELLDDPAAAVDVLLEVRRNLGQHLCRRSIAVTAQEPPGRTQDRHELGHGRSGIGGGVIRVLGRRDGLLPAHDGLGKAAALGTGVGLAAGGRSASISWVARASSSGPLTICRTIPFGSMKNCVGRANTL